MISMHSIVVTRRLKRRKIKILRTYLLLSHFHVKFQISWGRGRGFALHSSNNASKGAVPLQDGAVAAAPVERIDVGRPLRHRAVRCTGHDHLQGVRAKLERAGGSVLYCSINHYGGVRRFLSHVLEPSRHQLSLPPLRRRLRRCRTSYRQFCFS